MADNNVKMTITADAKAVVSEINKAKSEIEKLRNTLPSLRNSFDGVRVSTNGLVSSLLKLAGVASLVNQTIEAFKKTVGMSIEYNKTLETSKLGISAILTSMTKIIDAQGDILVGQDKFNAAQQIAIDAQKELQKIAMTTPASYRELVEVYQGILAPALSAKMTFKETLEITGLLTNAVKAIGLPINQIKQEARDLIQGGIQPASSSLAVALGISDSMVKKWREKGTVFSELKTRLEGFIYASREFENTWEGAWSNLKDILERAFGEGGSGLFGMLKRGIQEFSKSLVDVQRDADGTITRIDIKPEVIYRLRMAGSILADMVLSLKEIVKLIAAAASKIPLIGSIAKNSFLERSWKEIQENVPGVLLPRMNEADLDRLLKKGMSPEEIGKAISAGIIKIGEATKRKIGMGLYEESASATWDEEELNEFRERLMSGQSGRYTIKGNTQPLKDEQVKAIENWQKKLRDLQTDIDKTAYNSDELNDKLLEIEKKYKDLMQEASQSMREHGVKLDTSLLSTWKERMESHLNWEKQWKDYEESSKKREDAEKRYTELVNTLQTSTANEMENRIQKSIQEETKLTKELTEIWTYSEMTYEEYQERLKEIEERGARERAKIREEYDLHKIEAESRRRLALLDIAEKEMSMSKEDIARGRIAEYEKMLSYYENIRQKAIEAGDITARIQAEDKIAEINTKLNELNMTMKELTGSFTEGWARGLTEYLYNLKTTFQLARDMGVDTAQAMQQAFSDFFFDVFEGKLKSLSDYLNSFTKSVMRSFSNILAQQMMTGIQGFFMGSPTKVGALEKVIGSNFILSPGHHLGGMAYEPTFYRIIPRFHGGIGPDEVLSIIRKDEAVFTPGQMKALGSAIKSPNIKIEIHNNSGTPITARQQDVKVNPSEIIVPIVVDAIQRNVRGLRDMLGGK